tara:strand:+ start:77 stop:202 length:126 start_codon:yes stop_codon:yes gene_type:complete
MGATGVDAAGASKFRDITPHTIARVEKVKPMIIDAVGLFVM